MYREILPNRETVSVCVCGLGDLVSSSPSVNSAGTLVLWVFHPGSCAQHAPWHPATAETEELL